MSFAMPSATLSVLEKLPAHVSTKVIRILDLLKFYGKPKIDSISYRNWHLQMRNKMQANKVYMATKQLKILYVLSLVANNALTELSVQLEKDLIRLFTTAKEMF